VTKIAIKIVNFISAHSLKIRKMQNFLKEKNSMYKELLTYNNVCCLFEILFFKNCGVFGRILYAFAEKTGISKII
jgi:hypothetical protein